MDEINSSYKDLTGEKLSEVKRILDSEEVRYRIVSEDGETFIITEDYKPDRINLTVEHGIVINMSNG